MKNSKRFAIQPFLKIVQKKKVTPNKYPKILEPKPELVSSGVKKRIKLKDDHADLKIMQDVVPDDGDTRSPEYRMKLRSHYDALKYTSEHSPP